MSINDRFMNKIYRIKLPCDCHKPPNKSLQLLTELLVDIQSNFLLKFKFSTKLLMNNQARSVTHSFIIKFASDRTKNISLDRLIKRLITQCENKQKRPLNLKSANLS